MHNEITTADATFGSTGKILSWICGSKYEDRGGIVEIDLYQMH